MGNSALLVMDVQNGIVNRFADGSGTLLSSIAKAIDAARRAQVPVIYVKVGFRPGAPEISPKNRVFSGVAASGSMMINDHATDIHSAVAPTNDEIVVTKKRVSAFTGSDLDLVLRSLEIDTLVLTGITTSGVILSTVRQAADLDYELAILEDGCVDPDSDVHRILFDKVFPRQANVLNVNDWMSTLSGDAFND